MRRYAVTLSLFLSLTAWSSHAGELMTLYADSRSGRDLLVSGETPHATAMGWLAEVSKAADAAAVAGIHKLYAANGLKPIDADVLLAEETVITQYTEGFGGTLWVIGGTPLPSAAAWMAVVRDAKGVEPLRTLLTENHDKGLLACTFHSEGTTVTVAWGSVVAPSEGEAGESSPSNFDKIEEWMAKINEAKTEKDLVEIVRANHGEGLSTASGLRVSQDGVQMNVSVLLAHRGLLGRAGS